MTPLPIPAPAVIDIDKALDDLIGDNGNIPSVAKLVASAAVMQQVEMGLLDVDAERYTFLPTAQTPLNTASPLLHH